MTRRYTSHVPKKPIAKTKVISWKSKLSFLSAAVIRNFVFCWTPSMFAINIFEKKPESFEASIFSNLSIPIDSVCSIHYTATIAKDFAGAALHVGSNRIQRKHPKSHRHHIHSSSILVLLFYLTILLFKQRVLPLQYLLRHPVRTYMTFTSASTKKKKIHKRQVNGISECKCIHRQLIVKREF